MHSSLAMSLTASGSGGGGGGGGFAAFAAAAAAAAGAGSSAASGIEALPPDAAGLPHAHLEAVLVAFHAISVAPKAKKALLRRLYAGNLTLSQFARTQWTALVSV